MILIARMLCRLAFRCLPPAQRPWGHAMRAELDHISAPGAVILFAAGCLKAGLAQRLGDERTRDLSGRTVVVAIGLTCAAFHLGCAFGGIEVLGGGRLDPIVARLAGQGADSAAAYREVRPLIVLLIASLGIAHAVVAWQIWRGRLRAFVAAWSIGAALAAILGGCIFIFARTGDGIVIQSAGLMAQAAVVLWLVQPNLADARSAVSGE